MKRLFLPLAILSIVITVGCGSSNVAVSPEQQKIVDDMIEAREFRIENDWANPLMTTSMAQLANSGLMAPGNNIQRVSLIGNPNFLEVKGDSVKADLPYFGERQRGAGYDTDGNGIKFEDKVTDMDVSYNNSKNRYDIKFSAKRKTEIFNIIINVFGNGSSAISINSSDRNNIRYDGKIMPIPEK
ncbi:DUF4251 domain-containing protein [Robertkochia solimangrovi]|uniref:DUF4251 domain-containing protein n=1 Tax=Robertkochia solimangrovi TaxID=2213046 RepID=UPI0013A58DF7|nr:DUF4251 domain-containing protein [Robertkochia solimangrovi]